MYTIMQKRLVVSLSRVQPKQILAAVSSRAFTSKFHEKEKGDEKVYFNKQDGMLIYGDYFKMVETKYIYKNMHTVIKLLTHLVI